MKAIEGGIFTSGTKTRLEDLERKISELDCKIQIEECKEQRILRREDITEFIKRILLESPSIIIRNLIQKVIVLPDRLEIYYNYTENPPTTKNPDDTNRRDFLFDKNLGQEQIYITKENIIICVPTYLIKKCF